MAEGAFDALALIAAGLPRTIAIFGKSGWRWDWARGIDELVVAEIRTPVSVIKLFPGIRRSRA